MSSKITKAILLTTFILSGCGVNGLPASKTSSKLSPKPKRLKAKWVLNKQSRFVPGQLVVEFKNGFKTQNFKRFSTQFSLRNKTRLRIGQKSFDLLQLKNPKQTTQAIQTLQKNPNVLSVRKDPRYYAMIGSRNRTQLQRRTPRLFKFNNVKGLNDPFFALQWSLRKLDVPKIWTHGKGKDDLIVAVIDSGVDYTHPDLKDRVINGPDFMPTVDQSDTDSPDISDDDPMDELGHGTHVAGIIGAIPDNKIGISGIAPGVKVMNVKVLNAEGWGSAFAIARGITYAVDNGAKILNLSLGSPDASKPIELAVQYAQEKGVVVIAAAGNEFTHTGYPASFPGVIAVGATDQQDELADFSNHDSTLSVMAPGVDIMSTTPTFLTDTMIDNGIDPHYSVLSGTSMSTPMVAAQSALLMSLQPNITPSQLKIHIEKSAKRLGNPKIYGNGRIQILASLEALKNSASAQPPQGVQVQRRFKRR